MRPAFASVVLGLRLLAGALPLCSAAADLRVSIVDGGGAPLADAVAYALPSGSQPLPAAGGEVSIDQIDRQFVPRVSIVRVGTKVRFPNKDNIRHEVYSFSPAKIFQLDLYSGTPAAPVLFDKASEVTLGCNIHDKMIAYVYVVATPYFGKSGADGSIRLGALPPGTYTVTAQHPWLNGPAPRQTVVLKGGDTGDLHFALPLQEPPAQPEGDLQ
jgi:plastocyanin